MFRVIKMASAFIGVIVGAGFASGQEILQYFTSFGFMGTIAAIISTILFAYFGMSLTKIGSRLQTLSYKDAIYTISGRWLGFVVDAILVFTLFGVGVVMIAGAGSSLNQQFGLPVFIGSLLLVILIMLAMALKLDKVIAVIGSITPFLLIAIVGIAIYSLFTADASLSELEPIALEQEKSFPHWLVSAINYASFNIAVGAGMAIVMGASEKDERIASLGGFFGGLGIGVLIILAHLAIFSKVDVVAQYDLPLLSLVNNISPILGFIMSIILFGMIFNTGLGMFYGFATRFFEPGTKKFMIASAITLAIGFVLSFVGFTDLVAKVYSTIGYLGVFLFIALLFAPMRFKKLGINKR
ncbi:MAG TPA: hypothetical protein VK094_05035 [Pseudogracilibacillus sp.]|nr:hypothetical protein [Pseudogracilibacillus sp.]